MSKSFMNGKRFLSSAAACLVLVGWTLSASADVGCTVTNWDGSEGLSDSNVGTQGADNRRYFGPCGLRVPFGTTPAWLENNQDLSDSPIDADSYRARFFAFFNDLQGNNVPFFRGYDPDGDSVFTLLFDSTEGVGVDVSGDGEADEWVSIGNGWQKIEIGFNSGAAFNFSVNDDVNTVGTSPATNVAAVRLGNIDGQGTGSADFDEFDSRRASFPSEDQASVILLGDANANGEVNLGDVLAIRAEFLGGEDGPFAPGQADCTGSGQVNLGDVLCARSIFLSAD